VCSSEDGSRSAPTTDSATPKAQVDAPTQNSARATLASSISAEPTAARVISRCESPVGHSHSERLTHRGGTTIRNAVISEFKHRLFKHRLFKHRLFKHRLFKHRLFKHRLRNAG
jgi:hypothetical protein